MTNIYCAQVVAYVPVNTDSLVVEIDAPAGTTVKIRKIRIMVDDGLSSNSLSGVEDNCKKVKLIRESVAGTGGTSYTPIPLDGNNTPSVSTVNVGAFTVGTISATIDTNSVHTGTDYIWQAADEDDKIVIPPGGIFGITANPAA